AHVRALICVCGPKMRGEQGRKVWNAGILACFECGVRTFLSAGGLAPAALHFRFNQPAKNKLNHTQ
ncbi:MAG: hypothetical protein ACRD6X_20300, partial [Pyrinomonadaceae bacterium]